MTRLQRFFINGLVLAVASVVMRTVAVAFNAYVSASVGAEGMGLFTLVMSVYGFAATFALSGISLASMRLCAEAVGKEDDGLLRAYLLRSLGYAAVFGTAATLLLFFFAEPIGTGILGDGRTVSSLRLLALSLLPTSLSAVMMGYFNAVRRATKNAVMQVFEQAVRIILTVLGLFLLLPKGIEYACIALVIGISASQILSFLFAFVAYLFDRRKHKLPEKKAKTNGRGLLSRLCRISLPIAVSTYVRSGLTTLEHILIPRCLSQSGASREEALSSYGVLHGMSLPVLLYPAGILASFTGLLVPETAESIARGEKRRITYLVERILSFALFFSLLSAGLVYLLADELGTLVYRNGEVGVYVAALVPLLPVMYLDTTVDNILKGIGEQFYCMCVNVADALLSVVLVLIFLPRFGALGYVAVLLIAEIFNFSFSIVRLYRRVPFSVPLFRDVFLPTGLSVLSVALTSLLFSGVATSFLSTLLKGGVYLVLATLLFLFTGVIGGERREWLSKIFKRETAREERKLS